MAHEISLQLGDEREEVHDSNGFCKCCICRSWQNKKKSLQSHESNPWNYGETMKTVDRVNFAMIDVMAAYGKLNKEVAELTHLSEMTVRALNSAAYDIDFLSLKLRLCEEDFIAIGNKKWGKFKHHIDGTTVDDRIQFLIYLMHRVEFLDLKLSDLTSIFEELRQENPGTDEAKKLEKRFRNLAFQMYSSADYTLKERKLERDSSERERKMESILLSSA
ncbi:hypothetical protein F4821DRAFT_257759 [Hypoxylon rubiginosum]|uniref:Uncharacterized protein n=1 Tax=Hypoxylon rubiginosum TaxID=110542 RepID=A0ACC0D761_9PEZI|nr:hypothetical protein F4821DRAFT_257759 [Hypoxylon rubiginosum]